MADEQFYKEIDQIFTSYLSAGDEKGKFILRIRDKVKNQILEEGPTMNYSKILFDSSMNIYKKDKDGNFIKLENENFEVVVMERKN